ncbi:MAG: hypothetical protein HY521_01355 [Proteobacteria bacterium]|nr:hypothetical protein [Pseudomonadota bacterium]
MGLMADSLAYAWMRAALVGLAAFLLSAAAAESADTIITVSRDECDRVVRHTPAPDVTYKPGVDVYGRQVAPADLGGGSQIELPKEFTIDLAVDITDRFGVPAPAGRYEGKIPVGKVTVREGRVLFNGKEIGPEERLRIEAACREALEKQKPKK